MNYEAWRISYQSSEQAARAAFKAWQAAIKQGVAEFVAWDDQAYKNLAEEVEYWKAKASDIESTLDRIRVDLGPTHMGEPLINGQAKPTGEDQDTEK